MKPPFPDSYWLEPGRIVCGEYPRDIDDPDDHESLRALLDAGVRLFIDLTEEGELKPYWAIVGVVARELGIDPATLEHRRFAIRDASVPRSEGDMRSILRALRSARHRGLISYIHCLGGRGRTGTVAGCMLSEIFGHHGEEALNRLTERWQAGGYDPEAVMREFVHWVAEARHTPHGKVFDIGSATSQAIARYPSGVPWRQCGGMNEFSNGNGSLMRILPVALAYPDDPDLIRKASDISALTHAHVRSRFCCAFYCLVASDLLHGSSIVDATEFAWEILDQRMLLSPPERVRFERLHPNQLFARNEDEIRSGGHVIDTLEAALWVNARNDSYADTVLHAVNLGQDTDTTGCVAGGLAGLIHGEADIPPEWLGALAKRSEIVALAKTFAELASP